MRNERSVVHQGDRATRVRRRTVVPLESLHAAQVKFGVHRWASRRTVPSPMPIRCAIARQERPCARRLPIRERSTKTLGRPTFFPLARALRIPALTLSTIRRRSSSAAAPRTIFPLSRQLKQCYPMPDAGSRRTIWLPSCAQATALLLSGSQRSWRLSTCTAPPRRRSQGTDQRKYRDGAE